MFFFNTIHSLALRKKEEDIYIYILTNYIIIMFVTRQIVLNPNFKPAYLLSNSLHICWVGGSSTHGHHVLEGIGRLQCHQAIPAKFTQHSTLNTKCWRLNKFKKQGTTNYILKNSAHGRHRISRPMRIVACTKICFPLASTKGLTAFFSSPPPPPRHRRRCQRRQRGFLATKKFRN